MINKNIEKIRSACVLANPDILKLEFGCYLTFYDRERGSGIIDKGSEYGPVMYVGQKNTPGEKSDWFLYLEVSAFGNYDLSGFYNEYIAKILGRPIRLADVLLAIDMPVKFYTKRPTIKIELAELLSRWNLRKDNLTDQSDECLEFIANLLDNHPKGK